MVGFGVSQRVQNFLMTVNLVRFPAPTNRNLVEITATERVRRLLVARLSPSVLTLVMPCCGYCSCVCCHERYRLVDAGVASVLSKLAEVQKEQLTLAV